MLEQQLENLNTNITKLIAVMQRIEAVDATPEPTITRPAAPEPEAKSDYPEFNGVAYLKKGGECVCVKTFEQFKARLDGGFKAITGKEYDAVAAKAKIATPAPEAEAPEAAINYDQVKPLILELAKNGGRDKALEILKTFGVEKGPELKTEQYADAHKALSGALAQLA